MTIVTRLGHRDYDAALTLVSEAAATQGTQPFEKPTIELLRKLIGADRAGYFEYSGGGYLFGAENTFFVDDPVRGDAFNRSCMDAIRATVHTWPLRDTSRTRDATGLPLKMSDFLTRAGLRRNAWYCNVMRSGGIEHELKVWLPTAGCNYQGFFFVRGPRQRDFDERERAFLALIRPHFARIRARWERRRRPPQLTRREADVLELVAQGLTNAEIAARLVISRATVRTHLENVFEKLGVHTRTAAVMRLREIPTST